MAKLDWAKTLRRFMHFPKHTPNTAMNRAVDAAINPLILEAGLATREELEEFLREFDKLNRE